MWHSYRFCPTKYNQWTTAMWNPMVWLQSSHPLPSAQDSSLLKKLWKNHFHLASSWFLPKLFWGSYGPMQKSEKVLGRIISPTTHPTFFQLAWRIQPNKDWNMLCWLLGNIRYSTAAVLESHSHPKVFMRHDSEGRWQYWVRTAFPIAVLLS